MFLLDVPLRDKLLYFIYTLLDLMALVDSTLNESLSSHIQSLLFSIDRRIDQSELSSIALALWSLDHGEYEVSARNFMNISVIVQFLCLMLT